MQVYAVYLLRLIKRIVAISAPIASASQKPRSPPFPAWFLPNGTINASEAELERASDSAERWGHWCAGIVVVGLIVEIALIWLGLSSLREKIGATVADAMIAIGVALEIAFAARLSSCQHEIANRLRRQLTRRSVSKEQYEAIQTVQGRLRTLGIGYLQNTECFLFAMALQRAFSDAGVDVRTFPMPLATFGSGGLGLIDPNGATNGFEPLKSIALDTKLGDGLFVMMPVSSNVPGMPEDTPAILVYDKPRLPSASYEPPLPEGVVAAGYNGLNFWRKRKLPDGSQVMECSDDKETWTPGEITQEGEKKRESKPKD